MDVELRHLRAFQVLATELNFTRAAARLHLTQQALSNQIKQLETRIGATLFQRNSRQVTLTDAGRTLLARVPDILDTIGAAIADTRDTETGQRTELIVGIRGVTGLDITPRVLRAFAAEFPHVAVTVGKVEFDDASAGVLAGASDVGLIWLPAPEGLDVTPLLSEERIALLPADHPFAADTAVLPTELAVQPFAWWTDNRDLAARLHDTGRLPRRPGDHRRRGGHAGRPARRGGQRSSGRGLGCLRVPLLPVVGCHHSAVARCRARGAGCRLPGGRHSAAGGGLHSDRDEGRRRTDGRGRGRIAGYYSRRVGSQGSP
ncbi:LysR family transcriptional regulator [Nocardia sp. CA-128927]|uniref:LysR family transcriptional regulator n=1 Tax=Nocardia sp. CA-128927 TaxID=3239975 RepID=UPI003D98637B